MLRLGADELQAWMVSSAAKAASQVTHAAEMASPIQAAAVESRDGVTVVLDIGLDAETE